MGSLKWFPENAGASIATVTSITSSPMCTKGATITMVIPLDAMRQGVNQRQHLQTVLACISMTKPAKKRQDLQRKSLTLDGNGTITIPLSFSVRPSPYIECVNPPFYRECGATPHTLSVDSLVAACDTASPSPICVSRPYFFQPTLLAYSVFSL